MAITRTPLDGGDFEQGVESLTLTNAGATEVAVQGSTLPLDVSDQKILVELEVTESSAGNGSVNARLLASINDAAPWLVVATGSPAAALNTTGLNKAVTILDATGAQARNWRIELFTDGTDLVDPTTVQYTYQHKRVREGD